MGKLRPQICLAIVCATLIAGMGMYVGHAMGATEIVTAIIGAIFGFLGGVSLKVLENE
jgi:membrane associated rhomboid family serine protease